jgi:hypothetical protein
MRGFASSKTFSKSITFGRTLVVGNLQGDSMSKSRWQVMAKAMAGIVTLLGSHSTLASFADLHFVGSADVGFIQLGDIESPGAIQIDGQGQPATLTVDGPIHGRGIIYGSSLTDPMESLVVQSSLDLDSGGGVEGTYSIDVELPTTLVSRGTLAAEPFSIMHVNQPFTVTGGTVAGTPDYPDTTGTIHSQNYADAGIIDVHNGLTISGTLAKSGESYLFVSGGGAAFASGAMLNMTGGWFALAGADAKSTVVQQIISAYDHGKWDGPGITSDFVHGTDAVGIGWNDSTTATGRGGITAIFFPTSTVFTRPTYYGDCNLDGNVELFVDFNSYIIGLNGELIVGIGHGSGWGYGDFNYDGVTDIDGDFPLFVRGYFAAGGSADALVNAIETSTSLFPQQKSEMVALVPEPTCIILTLAGVGVLRRKR